MFCLNFLQGQFRSKQQTSSSNITNDVIEEPKAPISGSNAAISAPVPSAFAAPTPKEDAINANEVSTEDIVVPPPMDFGNDDNRTSEIQQHPQQHPQQRPQQPPDVPGQKVRIRWSSWGQDLSNEPSRVVIGAARGWIHHDVSPI